MKTEKKFLEEIEKMSKESLQILKDKTKLYGVESIGQLGAKAEFVQIHRKYTRLKNMLWDDMSTKQEEKYEDTLKDTLLDMINYCYITLYILKQQDDKKELD